MKQPFVKQSLVAKIIILILVVTAIVVAAFLAIRWANNLPVTLDQQYYGNTEVIDIDKSEYENLLASQQSFVVMVDNAGCTTTMKMREMMSNLPQHFKYYRILWPEAEQTNLKSYVKYFPSLVVVEKGKVKYYLRADSADDAEYYSNQSALESWLNSRINF